MTSPPKASTSSGPVNISPPTKKSVKNHHYYSPTEERNMSNPIPINIPRMPPSNPSGSSSSSSSAAQHQYHHRPHPHHRDSYERPSDPSYPYSQSHSHSSRETRGESPSSGRSPTISHSYNRSHPYPRRTSNNSQPERERERDKDRERERERDRDILPRIHLPPPNSMGSFKFSSESNNNHQLSPIEREFPSLSTSSHHESSWRNGSSDRPQIHRIPSSGSVGKSGGSGISLPPLHSISGSPTLPSSYMPPPSLDSSSNSTTRGSPRVYPSSIRSGFNPLDSAHSQRRSPSAGPSKLQENERDRLREREREYAQSRQHPQPQPEGYHTHEPSREESYELHRRSASAHSQSTVPLPNHPSTLPSHHIHQSQQLAAQQQQQQHHQPYDMPSPPLRALPPSSMPPISYIPPYGHGRGGGGGASLARSRSQSATSGFPRHGVEGEEVGPGGATAPTPGQSRRLAHLMSEQKRRESINSGFQALRQALPSSLPTDSKAIILRKAVSHISHLENILRRSGLTYSNSPPGMGMGMGGPPGAGGGGQMMSDNWSNSNEESRDRDRDSLIDDDENDRTRVKWEEDR